MIKESKIHHTKKHFIYMANQLQNQKELVKLFLGVI